MQVSVASISRCFIKVIKYVRKFRQLCERHYRHVHTFCFVSQILLLSLCLSCARARAHTHTHTLSRARTLPPLFPLSLCMNTYIAVVRHGETVCETWRDKANTRSMSHDCYVCSLSHDCYVCSLSHDC